MRHTEAWVSGFLVAFLAFSGTIAPMAESLRAEVEPLEQSEMREITGAEGIELQFNLDLGSAGSPMALSIQDGDGYTGSNSNYAFLGIEGLFLSLDVGATNTSDAISLDAFNAPNIGFDGALQLSMGPTDRIRGIDGGFDRAQVKYNIRGDGGNPVIGMSLGNGSGGTGDLDFDGSLYLMGNSN